MSSQSYRILPLSASGKFVAVVSYLTAIFSGYCAYVYLSSLYTCSNPERDQLQTTALALSILHGLLAVGFAAAAIALSRHDTSRYKLSLALVSTSLALGELVLVIGYGFAVGTACSI